MLVHELQCEVGHRFDGDFQGLENWSAQQDALDMLREVGITTAFTTLPCSCADVFDAWDKRYEVAGSKTLFYLVERGPGPGTLDTALLEQARGLGPVPLSLRSKTTRRLLCNGSRKTGSGLFWLSEFFC